METWKNTKHDPVNYEVSNYGNVRNKNTGIILKNNLKRTGYLSVTLAYKKHIDVSVHRLVAMAFIENPNNFRYINHKDENKQNNSVDNLEWCTCSYNNNYGEGAKARNTKVIQFNISTMEKIKEWNSMKDACKNLGICYQSISACCRKVKKSAGGYYWEYEDDINKKKWK